MAKIKPFKGVRPPKEFIEEVASRPYDVLNSQEARAEAEGNEKSLYHIIKPEIDFPEGTDEHDPAVYLKAAANFNNFQEKGWLVQDQKECYYVYAQTMNGKTQYGLVVGAYVPDYMNGTIKKHELTRRDKEEDRMKHVRVNNAIGFAVASFRENKWGGSRSVMGRRLTAFKIDFCKGVIFTPLIYVAPPSGGALPTAFFISFHKKRPARALPAKA